MRIATIGAVFGILALLAVSGAGFATATSAPSVVSKIHLFDQHISHVIFLVQENHAYDTLFGTYCMAAGSYCPGQGNGIPSGTCVPRNVSNPSMGCIVPFNFSAQYLSPRTDLPHNWISSHAAWDNGAMDGFYAAELNKTETFGHYNGTTAPVYWDLAEQYGLSDSFYSSALSYSLPNHWYLVASQAPAISYPVKLGGHGITWKQQSLYLNESNATPSIEDELVNSSVSWDYYDNTLGSYAQAITHIPVGPGFAYWAPLQGRAQSYAPSVSSHMQNRSQFFSDAANGTLPNVSWIIPDGPHSDHPVYNITDGQDWIASVVDALERSPEWNSTVLFVSWDEYGGFYDHVPPPALDANGDGFRVPLLAIGPWVRQGFIDHTAMDFDSILHLMEERFGLKCLGPRDCKAKLPLAMFNFNRAPRAPIQIPDYANASYPMPLQSSGRLPWYGPGAVGTVPYVDAPVGSPIADDPGIDWS